MNLEEGCGHRLTFCASRKRGEGLEASVGHLLRGKHCTLDLPVLVWIHPKADTEMCLYLGANSVFQRGF